MKIFLVIFLMLCIHLSTQARTDSLVAQIKEQYAFLDKKSYCRNLIERYKSEQQLKSAILNSGSDAEVVNAFNFGYKAADSDFIHFVADGIRRTWRSNPEFYVWNTQDFERLIATPNPHYVLRLNVKDGQIKIDSSTLKFNIFWIDGNDIRSYKSIIVLDGQIYTEDCPWAFILNRVRRRAAKHISRRKPTYILSCEGIGGVMYMLNDKIYVYDIATNSDYELDDFIKNH